MRAQYILINRLIIVQWIIEREIEYFKNQSEFRRKGLIVKIIFYILYNIKFISFKISTVK